ncbi:hypothetical protein CR513_55979, partial [Mucuna pruriens]
MTIMKNRHDKIVLTWIQNSWRIHIALVDQHKTTFTCPFSTFAYTRMSFGLCNAPSTFQRCMETNLVLNFEKCHFMVTKGIVLRHLISNRGIEVDKAKVDIIASLPNPASVREVFSFLGHVALKFLLKKLDAKPRLIRWMLFLQEFDMEIKDKKGAKNVVADHLSQLERDVDPLPIRDEFPNE